MRYSGHVQIDIRPAFCVEDYSVKLTDMRDGSTLAEFDVENPRIASHWEGTPVFLDLVAKAALEDYPRLKYPTRRIWLQELAEVDELGFVIRRQPHTGR